MISPNYDSEELFGKLKLYLEKNGACVNTSIQDLDEALVKIVERLTGVRKRRVALIPLLKRALDSAENLLESFSLAASPIINLSNKE